MKIRRKAVKHWLGNSYEDWIEDLIFRLLNNEVSVKEIKEEVMLMHKDYLDKEDIQAIRNAEDPNYPIGDNGTYDYFLDKLDEITKQTKQ